MCICLDCLRSVYKIANAIFTTAAHVIRAVRITNEYTMFAMRIVGKPPGVEIKQ
jgi:hypothetical protein